MAIRKYSLYTIAFTIAALSLRYIADDVEQWPALLPAAVSVVMLALSAVRPHGIWLSVIAPAVHIFALVSYAFVNLLLSKDALVWWYFACLLSALTCGALLATTSPIRPYWVGLGLVLPVVLMPVFLRSADIARCLY